MDKACTRCGEVKDLSGFHRNNQRKDGRESMCAVCRSAKVRELNSANPGSRRRAQDKHRLKSAYGISPEDVLSMSEAQGHVCALCGVADKLNVDHCHATGTVRGLLCRHCNLMLGHAKDNPEVLRKAAHYLEGGA